MISLTSIRCARWFRLLALRLSYATQYYDKVLMKNAVFWDVAPCRTCMNQRFGGTYRFHFQSRKIRERGTSLSRWQVASYKVLVVFLRHFGRH
jgi:hypothetical protein